MRPEDVTHSLAPDGWLKDGLRSRCGLFVPSEDVLKIRVAWDGKKVDCVPCEELRRAG